MESFVASSASPCTCETSPAGAVKPDGYNSPDRLASIGFVVVRPGRQNRHVDARRYLSRVLSAVVMAGVLAFCLSGCGLSIPADPDGTLDSVRGGELRVGVSPDPPLVVETDGVPAGSIVDLVDSFAASVDAQPVWTVATEETLVAMLADGDLDLIAGGITSDTPWLDRAGVSRGFTDVNGADGRELVMLVPLGENSFLSALERFIDREVGS